MPKTKRRSPNKPKKETCLVCTAVQLWVGMFLTGLAATRWWQLKVLPEDEDHDNSKMMVAAFGPNVEKKGKRK